MDSENITVDFWDVGQGDCCVITLPGNELIVIDVGPVGSPLAAWLHDRGGCFLKSVVLTHNHADHIGALPSVISLPRIAIGNVYMLVDRDVHSESFKRIMRPVRDAVKQKKFEVLQLTARQTVWQTGDGSARLKVCFPDFLSNIDATTPNETSGILTLELNGHIAVVWSGDSRLEDISYVVGQYTGTPEVLAGPHHGAPQDFKAKDRDTLRRIQAIGAEKCYISVGSWNGYKHPKRKYIKALRKNGCEVSCSQLTRQCEHKINRNMPPVLPSHALLGLRAPRSGVPCRGAMRFRVKNGELSVDEWDAEHRKRVREQVSSPACDISSRT